MKSVVEHKVRIYLAAPLFNEMERDFNRRLELQLRNWAEIFLPQRDGLLLTELIAAGMSIDIARGKIFQADVLALSRSDILVAILDGRTIDEGVAFELGYANAAGKVCIGLKTDDRALLPSGDNPMIILGCHRICRSIDELVSLISKFALGRAKVDPRKS